MHNRSITAERSRKMSGSKIERRYPIGAELIGADRVHFRVWAPKAQRLAVSLDGELHELERDGNRYFGGSAKGG
jgi:1,4-alpha-glucan branching enzyme